MTVVTESSQSEPLSFGLNFKLSTMMFLQYAIWGAWLPLLWPFLFGYRGFDAGQISHMFMVGAVGAIVAPFIAGQIADRYFRTEIFLGISHLIGAVLIWQLASLETYGSFLLFSLVYSLVYSPTLSLTNSLSFHHLPDRDRDFGKVRVWGTIGWIVVGIGIGQWLLAEYTLEPSEATQRIVDQRILDPEERSRLLSQAQVELKNGSSTTGRVTSEPGAATLEVVRAEGEPPITIAQNEVRSVVPIYARLAAEGKEAAVKALLDSVPDGNVPDTLRAELHQRAVEGDVFNEAAIQGATSAEHARGMKDAFKLSAILGALMGLFCFFLPKTPPARTAKKNASLRALGEVKKQPLLTLFLLAVPISCIHQFYFVHTAGFLGQFQSGFATKVNAIVGVGGGGLMTIGQMVEIAVLALMPILATRMSRKTLLAIGIFAYGARMAIFAYHEAIAGATGLSSIALLMVGVGLHGLCFGCFIFVAFMVVDEETTPDVRASAQSLFNLVIVGIGIIVGSLIAGEVATWATTEGVLGEKQIDFTQLFSVPMWASVACFAVLLVFYPGGRKRAEAEAT